MPLADTKDFRRALLVKVGLNKKDKVETRKILEEQILSETNTDVNKLVHFALKYQIPSELRLHCWKLLVDSIPAISGAQSLVWDEQKAQCHILYRGLLTMRKTSKFKRAAMNQDPPPSPEDLLRMSLLENASLQIDDDKQVAKSTHRRFLSIADRVIAICRLTLESRCANVDFETLLSESYWITKGFNRFLKDHENGEILSQGLLNELKCDLRLRHASVYNLLDSENMWTNLPIKIWFSCAFAQLLCPEALCLLWDKVFAGCLSILVFVAMELFEYMHKKLKHLSNGNSSVSLTDVVLTNLLHYASDVPSTDQEFLVKRAIEVWSNRGSCTISKKK